MNLVLMRADQPDFDKWSNATTHWAEKAIECVGAERPPLTGGLKAHTWLLDLYEPYLFAAISEAIRPTKPGQKELWLSAAREVHRLGNADGSALEDGQYARLMLPVGLSERAPSEIEKLLASGESEVRRLLTSLAL